MPKLSVRHHPVAHVFALDGSDILVRVFGEHAAVGVNKIFSVSGYVQRFLVTRSVAGRAVRELFIYRGHLRVVGYSVNGFFHMPCLYRVFYHFIAR